ncbi:MAG: MFS transporter [Verrucomicrobia bacterium]|nr:MFS transporter [Verrucomicrobiota bacterium]MDA1067710.1 MFS transporter [Verrucomicrobiota bacterium]
MSQLPSDKKNLGAILLTLFLDLVGFSIIFPLFPGMLEYYFDASGQSGILGWAIPVLSDLTDGDPFKTTVLFGGILGSLYSLMQFVFSPIWGRRSDRLGRKSVLKITILGTALSYLIWLLSGSFELLVLGRLLGGVMAGNISVATAAVADLTTKQNRSKGMALVGVTFGLGFIIGPAIGALLSLVNILDYFPALESIGINPFSVPALVALILTLVNYGWLKSRFKESLAPENRDKSETKGGLSSVLQMLSLKEDGIRQVNWLFLIFITAFSGMEFTLTFFAVERFFYTPAQNGYIFLYVGFLLVLIQGGIVRRLSPKVGEKRMAIAGLAFGVIAFLLLSKSETQLLFYVSLTFMALAGGLVNPSLTSLVSLYSTDDKQGYHLGLFRSAGSLARAIGPIIAAGLYWYFGASSAYLFAGFVIVIPLIRSFVLPNPDKDEAPI